MKEIWIHYEKDMNMKGLVIHYEKGLNINLNSLWKGLWMMWNDSNESNAWMNDGWLKGRLNEK